MHNIGIGVVPEGRGKGVREEEGEIQASNYKMHKSQEQKVQQREYSPCIVLCGDRW